MLNKSKNFTIRLNRVNFDVSSQSSEIWSLYKGYESKENIQNFSLISSVDHSSVIVKFPSSVDHSSVIVKFPSSVDHSSVIVKFSSSVD